MGRLRLINPKTAKLTQQRRNDIVYGWNDDSSRQRLQLVFEFKKISRQKVDRDHYLRENGLVRFVGDIYARKQASAAMVGILLDPEPLVVPLLRDALGDVALGTLLRLRPCSQGRPY